MALEEWVVTFPSGFVTTMLMTEAYKERCFPAAVRVGESPFGEKPASRRGRRKSETEEE